MMMMAADNRLQQIKKINIQIALHKSKIRCKIVNLLANHQNKGKEKKNKYMIHVNRDAILSADFCLKNSLWK